MRNQLLIVAIGRRFAEEQSCEGELQGGGVAIDHLLGDVQEDAVVVFVRVVQRTVRHEEEVFRGQAEGVRGCGSDGSADLLQMNRCYRFAIAAFSHTICVN